VSAHGRPNEVAVRERVALGKFDSFSSGSADACDKTPYPDDER